MKLDKKNQAICLRKEGKSVKRIAKLLKVSQGSVSVWVRRVRLLKKQKGTLALNGFSREVIEKRRASRLSNELQKRNLISQEAGRDIDSISKKELKLIGTMLYWAEGRKRGQRVVSFSNSDPEMIRIIMKFFRTVCVVPEAKFRGHIHTYSHLEIKKTEQYWSEVTGIPLTQFYKTYTKKSISSKGKMDSLPLGTLDIYIGDVKLFLTIMGWIKKVSGLVSKL